MVLNSIIGSDAPESPRPPRLSPKTQLLFFIACELLVYMDRGALAGLLPHIKEGVHRDGSDKPLSSAAAGWLGSVFMFGYTLASPIFARLSRRGHCWTARSIAIGLTVWTAACASTYFLVGSNYDLLVLCRLLTGVGEAAFCSLAPVVIDDASPSGRKSTYLGFFFMSIYVGIAIGNIVTAGFRSWQGGRIIFLIEACLMVPIILLCLRWQSRFSTSPQMAMAAPSMPRGFIERISGLINDMKQALMSRAFVLICLGFAAFNFVVGGLAVHGPTILRESLGASQVAATLGLGLATVLTGVLGTYFGGWLSDKVAGKDPDVSARARAGTKICVVMAAIGVVFIALTAVAKTTWLFLCMMSIALLALFSTTAPCNVGLMSTVPEDVRSQGLAISIGVSHLLGDFPSPVVIGSIADASKSWSLAILFTSAWMVLAVICWAVAYRHIRRYGAVVPTAPHVGYYVSSEASTGDDDRETAFDPIMDRVE
ncbi:Protein spinster 3 [Perkinsus chesapeaki]|uniref:Protein spinster 3 n=1 Tax=Perkinsus chesapeaki TaxID=330153 RepID=A0A7J6MYR9_PERCH|nr:Protein spinster 3 [Perkinsus chesapeaki]